MQIFLGLLLGLQLQFSAEIAPLPEIHITQATLIDTLSEYTVLQETNPTFCKQYYGMTDFNSRTITICMLTDDRRLTLLHEVYHILYHRIGIQTGGPYEPYIEALAEKAFTEIYGPKEDGTKGSDAPKQETPVQTPPNNSTQIPQ